MYASMFENKTNTLDNKPKKLCKKNTNLESEALARQV
jgi:hypothetical protein